MKLHNKIDETQLHEIWQKQEFLKQLVTFSGESISILNSGTYNQDSVGPDFKNGRVKIGNLTLVILKLILITQIGKITDII